jgi:hypothetical protein
MPRRERDPQRPGFRGERGVARAAGTALGRCRGGAGDRGRRSRARAPARASAWQLTADSIEYSDRHSFSSGAGFVDPVVYSYYLPPSS